MTSPEGTFEIILAHRFCLESLGDIARGLIECASVDFAVKRLSETNQDIVQVVDSAATEARKALYRLSGGLKALQASLGNNVLCDLKADSYCIQNPIKATFDTQPQGLLRAYLNFLMTLDQGLLLMDATVTGGLIDRRQRNRYLKRSSTFLPSALRRIRNTRADVLSLLQCNLNDAEDYFPLSSEALGIQFERLSGTAVLEL